MNKKHKNRSPNSNNALISKVQVAQRSSPLPSPSEFSAYDQTLPGAANRILTMAEKGQEHVITTEQHIVKQGEKRANIGLVLSNIPPIITPIIGGLTSWMLMNYWPLLIGCGASFAIYFTIRITVSQKIEQKQTNK